jgi:hypothetical protein
MFVAAVGATWGTSCLSPGFCHLVFKAQNQF